MGTARIERCIRKTGIDPTAAKWSWKGMTPDHWDDFERMFAKHKGCHGGCWCAWHLMPSSAFIKTDREHHRLLHKQLVAENKTQGVICYLDDVPVGWCQFGSPAVIQHINGARIYKKAVQAELPKPDWCITCVFVDKDFRRLGLSEKVLSSALQGIAASGGGLTEAFPLDVAGARRPSYPGNLAMYLREGFDPIMSLGGGTTLVRKWVDSVAV